MEIRSDTFSNNVGVQKPLPPLPSVSTPSPLNMRMSYGQEGMMGIFRPVVSTAPPPPPPPPYQGGETDGIGGAHQASVHSGIFNSNMAEVPVKRKRGRPRKYGADGMIAVSGSGFSLNPGVLTPTSMGASSSGTKKKGRPLGSGKKHQMDALGSGGIGFTPHIITVNAGEDVSSKIMSFSQHGPRALCILSANGAISNVTLRQAATSGGTVTLEGRFEILSLSGSFLLSESGGQRSRTGGLSVSLADPDGRVIGGGVAGFLTAASPVQVVVGSFIFDSRKERKPMSNSDPTLAPAKMAPGETSGAQSPGSHGTMSESSGGGPGSSFNQRIGASNNTNQQIMSGLPWK